VLTVKRLIYLCQRHADVETRTN